MQYPYVRHFELTLICFTLLCFALLYFALLCFASPYFTLLCFTLLCIALLCFILLCSTLPYFTLLCFTLLCILLTELLKQSHLHLHPARKSVASGFAAFTGHSSTATTTGSGANVHAQ
jgi:hypothetical protein